MCFLWFSLSPRAMMFDMFTRHSIDDVSVLNIMLWVLSLSPSLSLSLPLLLCFIYVCLTNRLHHSVKCSHSLPPFPSYLSFYLLLFSLSLSLALKLPLFTSRKENSNKNNRFIVHSISQNRTFLISTCFGWLKLPKNKKQIKITRNLLFLFLFIKILLAFCCWFFIFFWFANKKHDLSLYASFLVVK